MYLRAAAVRSKHIAIHCFFSINYLQFHYMEKRCDCQANTKNVTLLLRTLVGVAQNSVDVFVNSDDAA